MARTTGPETAEAERLLKAAQRFLQQRNFRKCSKYARQAHLSDPAHPGPHQILSISAVLSAVATDHYSVLSLPSPTEDQTLIKTHFQNLSALLHPITNPFPFASQAYDLVLKAWSVLSNPARKTRFDKGFKMNRDRSRTFWTMCPYCYYVYEYENAYLDYCMRCQNATCRKAFHAVALRGPPPPPEVVVKGKYACNGFLPVVGGGGVGENGWAPFVSGGSHLSQGGDGHGKSVRIEISDDQRVGKVENKGKKVVGSNAEKVEVKSGVEIKEKVNLGSNVETVERKGGVENKEKVVGLNVEKMEVEGPKREGNSDGGFVVGSLEKEGGSNNSEKKWTRRKKMVPRNSKKFMGRGRRGRRDEAVAMAGVEGEEENGSDENSGSGGGMGCGESSKPGPGVEFFDGEDDIFVGLQDINDK